MHFNTRVSSMGSSDAEIHSFASAYVTRRDVDTASSILLAAGFLLFLRL